MGSDPGGGFLRGSDRLGGRRDREWTGADCARRQLATAVALIRASPRARLVAISEPLFQRALDLYASRQDKSWGLVDCSSFLVMQDAGIQDTFTNDRHFNQAGFRCLLPLP